MNKILTKIGLYIIIFLPITGELIRLPLGSENKILLSDAIIPIVFVIWFYGYLSNKLIQKNSYKKDFNHHQKTKLYSILFLAVALLSLIQSLLFLELSEVISGSMYLIRWIVYFSLYFITYHTIKTEKDAKNILIAITISTILLAVLGFIQLIIYPDLTELETFGWDPHINRLVSTWLDPNFLGGLFAFIIIILLGLALTSKSKKTKALQLIPSTILTIALFLTYSRSALLALITGVFSLSILKSRKLIIITLIILTIGITTSERARFRTIELIQSISSVFTQTAQTPDPTARLRLQSYNQTISIIKKYPLLGVGYNNLRKINHKEGFVTSQNIHSASGSDSSILTIQATTGIIGLIPFLLILLNILLHSWKNIFDQKNPLKPSIEKQEKLPKPPTTKQKNLLKTPLTKQETKASTTIQQGLSLGVFSGTIALLTHSIFVNSLLYSHILIYFWITIGLYFKISSTKFKN